MDRNQKQAWGWILALVAVVALVWAGFAWWGDTGEYQTGVGETEIEETTPLEGPYEENETFGGMEDETLDGDTIEDPEPETDLGATPLDDDEEVIIEEEETEPGFAE